MLNQKVDKEIKKLFSASGGVYDTKFTYDQFEGLGNVSQPLRRPCNSDWG